jgi:hypothetical protein
MVSSLSLAGPGKDIFKTIRICRLFSSGKAFFVGVKRMKNPAARAKLDP